MGIEKVQGTAYNRPARSILRVGYSLLVNDAQTKGADDLMLFAALGKQPSASRPSAGERIVQCDRRSD